MFFICSYVEKLIILLEFTYLGYFGSIVTGQRKYLLTTNHVRTERGGGVIFSRSETWHDYVVLCMECLETTFRFS